MIGVKHCACSPTLCTLQVSSTTTICYHQHIWVLFSIQGSLGGLQSTIAHTFLRFKSKLQYCNSVFYFLLAPRQQNDNCSTFNITVKRKSLGLDFKVLCTFKHFQIHTVLLILNCYQGDCREEARRAHKIPISAQNGPFGQPGR